MDTRTNVVNDLPITPSQTIPINYESNPLEFYSPIGQVVQNKGDEALGGSQMDDLGCCDFNLGFMTKARACKGVGQKGSPRVTFHTLGVYESVRE
jgi:hypothetical protein